MTFSFAQFVEHARSMPRFGLALCSAVVALACTSQEAKYANGPSCEERQAQLVSSLQTLPELVLATPTNVPLAQSTLAGAFGQGAVLEINEPSIVFNGTLLSAQNQAERVEQLHVAVSALPVAASAQPLYVAAAATTDIRSLHAYLQAVPQSFDVRLTFVRPPPQVTDTEDNGSTQYADKLLLEPNPQARRQIALSGYDAYSDCAAIDSAVAALANEPEASRFGKLKTSLLSAVPQCQCADIDPDGLRQLVVAEQRAGNVALGSSPADFLRDVRCRASMPLRSVQQVLTDIERFEDEFSGNWDATGVTFEQVVTNDRLFNYLCGAMPGELFETLSADFASLFVRTPNAPTCREFRLEPVAKGAVFGTLRGVENAAHSFHFRLGGNDLRLFGPLPSPESRPTDVGPWACDKEHKLSASDSSYLQVESGGRLFFTREACEQSKLPEATLSTCAFDPNLVPPVAPTPTDGTAPAPTQATPSPTQAAPSLTPQSPASP